MKTRLFAAALLSMTLVLQSCGGGESTIQDTQLSGFMMGGAYFVNGYGGTDQVASMMESAGYTSNQELVDGYKQIFEFPFETSQGAGVRSMFVSVWDIHDKEDLMNNIEEMKSDVNDYKAWDYSRIVNNACMGYAAGYLSKEEVIAINNEVLPLAQKDFANWEAYFKNFLEGRKDWNPDDEESGSFEAIATSIVGYENSIYQVLPLN